MIQPQLGVIHTDTFRLIESPLLTKKVLTKKPRKKRNRRWNKKYWKRYSVEVPSDEAVQVRDGAGWVVIVHPALAETVRAEWRRAKEKVEREMFGMGYKTEWWGP